MTGNIFDIKHFAVCDGPGIRTTVFFKGCSLRCVWCHNPEGLSREKQLSFREDKCLHCGRCIEVCPNGAQQHTENGQHIYFPERCTHCGICVKACLGQLLTLYGREVTVPELLPEILEDRDFYEQTHGGVTLSGGECLLQADFCAELLSALRKEGIHTAVDTCGNVPWENIEKVLPLTDLFLYDMKAINAAVHTRCTGQDNALILENLARLEQAGKPVEIRIPFVKGWNDDQIVQIGAYLQGKPNITKVRVLPYHHYASTKYASLRMPYSLQDATPDDSMTAEAACALRRFGLTVAE